MLTLITLDLIMNRKYNVVEESAEASEEFKTWLRGVLHDANDESVTITFTKTDGTKREMRCTQAHDLIPGDKVPKGTTRALSDEVARVFDLDKQEWRSFRWDSIISVDIAI